MAQSRRKPDSRSKRAHPKQRASKPKRLGPAGRVSSVIEATRMPLRLLGAVEAEPAALRAVPRLADLARIVVNWRILVAELLGFFRWHRLDFSMQHQQQTNWCWAATSTSVALFYDPASTWTQCAVANGELSRNDCCGAGASGPCNVYGFLGSSLTRVGHFDHSTGSSSTFATVQTEVNAGRPLGVRTAWSGGGAHFLCVIGYRIYEEMLAVDDPWYGKSDVDYDTFGSSYQGSGSWTHSYFTQA
jgi:hypothetical protein